MFILAIVVTLAAPAGTAASPSASPSHASGTPVASDSTRHAKPSTAISAALPAVGPVHYSPTEIEQIIQLTYRNREKAEDWLHYSRESYLGAVNRVPFKRGRPLTVGSDSTNDLVLVAPAIQPHHLRITVQGDSFHVATVDTAARFEVDATPTRDTVLAPSAITIGQTMRFTLRLSHQNAPAIIVFDQHSKGYENFHGLKYYPFDINYRFVVALEGRTPPDTVTIPSTQGSPRRALRMGWFDFELEKKRCRLAAYHLLEPGIPEGDVVIFFRDATSGKETWKDGRILPMTWLHRGNRYVLDFNLAANPACAVSPYYNCPLPLKENTLKVSIPAGEKDMHYLGGHP